MVVINHNDMVSLRSKITQKILSWFFLNKDQSFYVNQLAKNIQEDPSNVYKQLLRLKKEGILLDEFQGKERHFFLNKNYPFLQEYKGIVLRGIGIERYLKEKLKGIKGINSVYIFGSYAQDKLVAESDIDILVVGNFDGLKLQRALVEIQRLTGREINSIELTEEEFNKRKKRKDPFLADAFSKKYIKVV